jgi:hypothetical protein
VIKDKNVNEIGNQVSLNALGGRQSIPLINGSSQEINNLHKSLEEFELEKLSKNPYTSSNARPDPA